MILQTINDSLFLVLYLSKDLLKKAWGWDMLLPWKGPVDWSDYINYLEQYYKHNRSVIAEVTGVNLVTAAHN